MKSSSACDREIGAGFAVGGNYIWRNYGNFHWQPNDGRRDRWTSG